MEIKVSGLEDVQKNLLALGAISGEKVMRSVMFYASRPLEQRGKANAAALPNGSGALHRAIRRVWVRGGQAFAATGRRFLLSIAPKTRDRTALALANLFYKRRRQIRGVYWGHLVEWGFNHRGGGRVAGRGIFGRAVSAGGQEVIDRFIARMGRASERALKRQDAAQ